MQPRKRRRLKYDEQPITGSADKQSSQCDPNGTAAKVENSATTATSEHSNTDQQTVSTNESVFEYTAEPLIQDSIQLEPNTEMIQTMEEQPILEAVDHNAFVQEVIVAYNEMEQGKVEPEFELPSTSKKDQNPTAEFQSNVSGNVFVCSSCGTNIFMEKKMIKHLKKECFMEEIFSSDDTCFYYTGVPNRQMLRSLFHWLEGSTNNMKLWGGKKTLTPTRKRGRRRVTLTPFEEFVLTLVRIRRGFDIQHLAYLFGLSTSHVSRIFTTWVNLLAKCLKPLLIWPTKEVVKGNLPESFRDFPRTRCIIDCSEIYVEKPLRPKAQRITWSNYKHNNTFKFLVGIAPTGTITYISKLYSGSISDVNIVKSSGFLDKVEEGDDIMADRGFNIRHLLIRKKATLNIPAFSHGKALGGKALKQSRKIASVRIHVERAIRRMKTFKIISGIVALKLRHKLNQIMTIVAVLCNLQDRLVKM